MRTLFASLVAGAFSLLSGAALAQSQGAVKVECWGFCSDVTLGEVCDTYSDGSEPLAVACDDTAVGAGWEEPCGFGQTCRPYGTLYRSDLLGDYCDDGGGYDAVVTCTSPFEAGSSAIPKRDDGAGKKRSR